MIRNIEKLKFYFFLTFFILSSIFVLLNGEFSASLAEQTSSFSGTWISNVSFEIVQAEIDGKIETVCLPKFEFKGEFDKDSLQAKIKKGISRQGAIFYLYRDDMRQPIRKGNMLFASGVYLKEMKMTFVGVLRSWGFTFKVSKTPAFQDQSYFKDIQASNSLSNSSKINSQQGQTSSNETSAQSRKGQMTKPGAQSSFGPPILTKFDVLPKGVLHPSIRKLQKEMNERIKQIKNHPFQPKIPRLDPIRWASGKMGALSIDGSISNAYIEGQTRKLHIQPPQNADWLNKSATKSLEGQSCEFILHRDLQGREAERNGKLLLADIYFTTLGETWEEWLIKQKLTPASPTNDLTLATSSIVLSVSLLEGHWKSLKTWALGVVSLNAPPKHFSSEELFRIPLADCKFSNFKAFRERLDSALSGKPVQAAFLISPDGKPYTELGQKRALRIFFPEQKTSLPIFMKKLCEK